jgi:hypothetical protein
MDDAMSDNQKLNVIQLNWRWLVVTYCFLILFHLLPSLLMSNLWQFFFGRGIWRFSGWAWGGMALVGTYVAYRATSMTIIGSGLASMLYMATVVPTVSDIREIPASGARYVGLLVALHLIAFLFGCFGGAAGEWLKSRKAVGDPSKDQRVA